MASLPVQGPFKKRYTTSPFFLLSLFFLFFSDFCRNPRALLFELLQLNLDRSSLSPPRGHRLETGMMIIKTWALCLERWFSASVAPLVLWVDLVALAGPICLF